jgi:hypothetical protein
MRRINKMKEVLLKTVEEKIKEYKGIFPYAEAKTVKDSLMKATVFCEITTLLGFGVESDILTGDFAKELMNKIKGE